MTSLRIGQLDQRLGSNTTNPFQPLNVDSLVTEAVTNVMEDSTQMAELVKALIKPLHDAIKENLIQAVNEALTLTFRATIDGLEARIRKLEQRHQENADLAEVQEQYSRRNCLFFFGVPEHPGEDTNHIISDICTNKLKVKVNPSDLDRSHRLGVKPDPKPDPTTPGPHKPKTRGIIVKFARYDVRAEVYRSKKKLKGSRTFISESLTSERLDVYTQIRKDHEDSVTLT